MKINKTLIFARDDHYGIGRDGTIPWYNREDLQFFQRITTSGKSTNRKNALICGTKTYETMKNINPVNRTFFVVGNNHYPSIQDALNNIDLSYTDIFFVGGAQIYQECQYLVDEMYITHIKGNFNCDTHFKPDFSHFQLFSKTNCMTLTISHYKSLNTDETYNNLCYKVLDEGISKDDRTGTGTISIFGHHMKFSLKTLPVITTKKVYLKGVIEELIWFLKGDVNSKTLETKGVGIWKGNSSREFLDNSRLDDYIEGECGPIYGFQWRHWNAPYHGPSNEYYKNKYKDKGIDQIHSIINTIKTNPDSRRIILNAWNVEQLPEMVLPPCHVMCQFYVVDDQIDCHMYQRSADVFLGLPFNITSYAILTHIIGHFTNKTPRNLYISIGDAHIYKNHIEQVNLQLTRTSYDPPSISINPGVQNIDNLTYDDIKIHNYVSHPTIKATMAV